MSKKRDNDPLDRINAAYDAAFNDVAEMSQTDVRGALAEAGVDRDQLRARLHERANQLARQMRSAGESAPSALKRLLEQTADSRELPDHPQRAFEKASKYLSNLFGPAPSPAPLQIVGAFRGEGDLTERDQQTLDAIDEELLRRAEEEDGDKKT